MVLLALPGLTRLAVAGRGLNEGLGLTERSRCRDRRLKVPPTPR